MYLFSQNHARGTGAQDYTRARGSGLYSPTFAPPAPGPNSQPQPAAQAQPATAIDARGSVPALEAAQRQTVSARERWHNIGVLAAGHAKSQARTLDEARAQVTGLEVLIAAIHAATIDAFASSQHAATVDAALANVSKLQGMAAHVLDLGKQARANGDNDGATQAVQVSREIQAAANTLLAATKAATQAMAAMMHESRATMRAAALATERTRTSIYSAGYSQLFTLLEQQTANAKQALAQGAAKDDYLSRIIDAVAPFIGAGVGIGGLLIAAAVAAFIFARK